MQGHHRDAHKTGIRHAFRFEENLFAGGTAESPRRMAWLPFQHPGAVAVQREASPQICVGTPPVHVHAAQMEVTGKRKSIFETHQIPSSNSLPTPPVSVAILAHLRRSP